jgi:hypothetical protein
LVRWVRGERHHHVVNLRRLVLSVFVGPCPHRGYEARQEHYTKNAEVVQGLKWALRAENAARNAGRRVRGEDHPRAKLTEDDVRKIRVLVKQHSHRAVAERFGVSRIAVLHIANGKAWKHVSDTAPTPTNGQPPRSKTPTAFADPGRTKLTEEDVRKIRKMATDIQSGNLDMNHTDIAVRFGVSPATVSLIVRGLSWKHLL